MKIPLLILLSISVLEYGYALSLLQAYLKITVNLMVNKLNHDEPMISNGPKWAQNLMNGGISVIHFIINLFHMGLLVLACWMIFKTYHQITTWVLIIDLIVIAYAIYDWMNSTYKMHQHLKIPGYYENQFNKNENDDDKSIKK